jgi:hypothetical protein
VLVSGVHDLAFFIAEHLWSLASGRIRSDKNIFGKKRFVFKKQFG